MPVQLEAGREDSAAGLIAACSHRGRGRPDTLSGTSAAVSLNTHISHMHIAHIHIAPHLIEPDETQPHMDNVKNLASSIPDAGKDIRLNLQSVLADGSLSAEQRIGVALACAFVSRNPALLEALLQDAAQLDSAWTEDAKAAAALMAMNNVLYRFRHMIGKESYAALPARLRMQRLAQPETSKFDFELMCIAVSAIHGCEMCVRSHEHSLIQLGASEAQVFDAVRIASVVFAASVALNLDPQGTATESP